MSRILSGGLIALVALVLVVGGTVAGGAIALHRTAAAEAAAFATAQASVKAARPGVPRPTPGMVQLPGQARLRPGIAGVVLDVTRDEITIKSRQGPTARIVVGPTTILRRRGKTIALSEVRPGQLLIAAGKPNQRQRTVQAAIVVVDPPGQH